jgi:hypothetical protein
LSEHRAFRVTRVSRAIRGILVFRERRDLSVTLEQSVRRELEDSRVIKDLSEHRAFRAIRVSRGIRVIRVFRERREPSVILVA